MKIIYLVAIYIIGLIVFITVMETFGIGDTLNTYLETTNRTSNDNAICK